MQQQMEGARRNAMGMAGVGMATGILGAFIPGMGFAQQALMMGQMRRAQQDAAEGQTHTNAIMGNMEAVMPQMMRGERLYGLAQQKQCAFLQEGGAPPPR